MSSPTEIAIIGAGFSGTLVATHLLKKATIPLRITLIEHNAAQFARGVAYSTDQDCHLLNVPADNMSALPDDPGHFLRWARTHERLLINPPWVTEITPASFLPRRAYGEYLRWVLDVAEQAAPRIRLERRIDKVVGLKPDSRGFNLRLASNKTLRAQKVVLALGNFRPSNPTITDPAFYASPRYHGNPWLPGKLSELMQTDSCLLIGSGLTMVDWAIALNHAGYRGTIHVVSRRGLWPNAHAPASPVEFGLDTGATPRMLHAWLHGIRQYIRDNQCDWRPVIDALRPNSQELWRSLAEPEKRRFLKRLRPFWDCHRHRIAPQVAARLNGMVKSGQLVRHAGRIVEYRENDRQVDVLVRLRDVNQTETIHVGAVVNCSGSESDYRELESPLVRDLLTQGLIHHDPLALGLDVTPDGALIGAQGVASTNLYTLGPPQKGILWETTAVPEIRAQAGRLTALLLEQG